MHALVTENSSTDIVLLVQLYNLRVGKEETRGFLELTGHKALSNWWVSGWVRNPILIWMTYFLHFSWLWFRLMVSICFTEKLLAERLLLYLPVDTRIDIQNVVKNSDSSIKWWVYILLKDLWLHQPQRKWFPSYWVDFKYN